MSNIVEMEAFRLKRELLQRQGKSIAGKIIAASMIDNAKAVINPSGLKFTKAWIDELAPIPPSAFYPKPGVTDD